MVRSKIKIRFIPMLVIVPLLLFFNPLEVRADHCNTLGNDIAQQDCITNPQDWHDTNTTTELNTGSVDVTGNPIYTRLNTIINILSVGVGIVITASVVYAGIQYITSRGDPNKTQAAINRIIQAGIALALYVFGWTILNWLIPGGVFQ